MGILIKVLIKLIKSKVCLKIKDSTINGTTKHLKKTLIPYQAEITRHG